MTLMPHETTDQAAGNTRLLPWAIAGYGMDIALVSIAGWPGASPSFVSSEIAAPFTIAKNLVFCLCFLLVFLLTSTGSPRMHAVLRRPPIYWAPSLSFIVGFAVATCLPKAFAAPSWASLLYTTIGGMLVGGGIAGNFILWVFVLCSQNTPMDARCIIGGTAVGGALYFLLAWLSSWVVMTIAALVIAPGTSALLALCAFRLIPAATGDDARQPSIPSTTRVVMFYGGTVRFPSDSPEHRENLRKGILALLAPCLTIGAIGFVMQIVRLGLSMATPASEELVGNLNSLALVASSGITWALFERNRYHLDMGIFYRVAAPGIGLACALLPFLGVGYGYALSFALYTIFSVASMMGILACNQVSRHYLISPVAMYALSFGIIYSMRYLPAIPFNALANSGVDLEGTAFATLPSSLASVLVMFAAYVFSDRFQTAQDTRRVYSWESELASPDDTESRNTARQSSLGPIAQAHGLTEREREVVSMLMSGRSIPAAAERMGVSPNTVRFHCKNVYVKLGVHSRQELIELIDREQRDEG